MSTILTIGLTGGIGSGKSTVADLFAELGATVIDADHIAKKLTDPSQPAFSKIITHFGEGVLTQKKQLDRKKLRNIIFQYPKERQWLEKLLHPLIIAEIKQLIKKARSPYCIVVAPLLLESQTSLLLQRILVIDSPLDLQIARVQRRDHISKSDAQAIINTQLPRSLRLAKADDVIDNSKNRAALRGKVKKLHEIYLDMVKR